MRASVLVREVTAGIGRHPLRSALIAFTFAIGFGSALLTISTVEGGRRTTRKMLEGLGIDVIACFNPMQLGPVAIGRPTGKAIDQKVIEDLRGHLGDQVREVVPMLMEMTLIYDPEDRSAYATTTMAVTSPEFAGILRSGVLAGRFFGPEDRFEGGSSPVVMDEALARLFLENPADAVGMEFPALRQGQPFRARVVGVMRDPILLRRHLDAWDAFAKAREVTARRLEFRNLYVPYDPAKDRPSGALVQVGEVEDVESVDAQLTEFFQTREIEPLYYVQKQWVDSLVEIVDQFSFLAQFLWIVDLVGVLILAGTISFLAVEERFGEVALRRAEGATRADVVLPLILEGMVLAIAALPVGWVMAEWIMKRFIQPILLWEPEYTVFAVVGTPCLLLLVGAGMNYLPARRIAGLSPARVLGGRE